MKRMIAILLAVCLLSGCQLARLERNGNQDRDKLVGIFVTGEYLDLGFDMEGYIEDHGVPKGEIDPAGYEGRLYAEVGEAGWSFPGYDGIIMGRMWKDGHWVGFSTDGICELSSHVTDTPELQAFEEKGTVYVPAGTDAMIYPNPVYMTADGRYYTVAEMGDFAGFPEGGSMSQSIKEETTRTEDGDEITDRTEYTLEIRGVKPAERVVLIHMDTDHRELKREEYNPAALPETVDPADGATYIIVEEYSGDTVTRTLSQPGEDTICVYFAAEYTWCLPGIAQVNWND